MKRLLTLYALMTFSGIGAQFFLDDFESYSQGSYIGPQSTYWTTWSGNEGGTEDVQVTSDQSSSGSNSIYFSSTSANGGPQDVVLDFGQLYTDGVFSFESDFYINPNKTGYFNFQGSQTIGSTWSLNVNFDSGDLFVDDGITSGLVVSTYPEGTWFTFRIEANLTLKVWKAYLNDELIGTWINGINAIASLDLYPIQNSEFYVDDVSFDHQSYVLSNLNAMMAMVDMGGVIAGEVTNPSLTIVNAGITPINSCSLNLNYNGIDYPFSLNSLNILSTENYSISIDPVTLEAGDIPFTAIVSNVNGLTDDFSLDDTLNGSVNPVVPAPGKMVVSEEATGTWCQWCPRGSVFMDQFNDKYSDFWIGIAIHNGDPMTVEEYDTPFGGLISGYPSSVVDRGLDVDPSNMTPDFLERIQVSPKAFIANGATWDVNSRELNVSVTANLQSDVNNSYKLACVLTEDNVTGTSSGYNQSNAYAGGGNGEMGGYESLPNPVPASQMVYDHVARAISPSFNGENNSFPSTALSGESHTINFSFVLPAEWDENNIHVIGLLIDPSGRIDNAYSSTIDEAVSNGYVDGSNLIVEEIDKHESTMNIFPNPVSNNFDVKVNSNFNGQGSLEIKDISGKKVYSKSLILSEGMNSININGTGLSSGYYLTTLRFGNTCLKSSFVKE